MCSHQYLCPTVLSLHLLFPVLLLSREPQQQGRQTEAVPVGQLHTPHPVILLHMCWAKLTELFCFLAYLGAAVWVLPQALA